MFDTFEILNSRSQSVIYQVLSQVCSMCAVSLTFSSSCQCFHQPASSKEFVSQKVSAVWETQVAKNSSVVEVA